MLTQSLAHALWEMLTPSRPPAPLSRGRVTCAHTQDTLVSEPIRVMLGGSAANFAVHATNLNRVQPPFELLASATPQDDDEQQLNPAAAAAAAAGCGEEAGAGAAAAAAVESCEATTKKKQACVLHTSVASDDMGAFVRGKLLEHGVEWSQTKAREHQVWGWI